MTIRDNQPYNTLRFLGSPWSYQVNGLEHVRLNEAAVFIANHLASLGPMVVVLSLPIRLYPWISAEMLDPGRAPGYLYQDFIRPTLHLRGSFGLSFARLLARITVPLLNGLGCIPVEQRAILTPSSFRRSLELLKQGESVLIFPEDELQPADPETGTHPFLGGFVQLCLFYQRHTGKSLPVYPMAVHPPDRTILIDTPHVFDQPVQRREALDQACINMRHRVQELFLLQEGGDLTLQEEEIPGD